MSNDARSAVKNSVASISGQLINLVVGIVSSVYIARVLGKDQFGMISWAFGLYGIMRAFACFGIDNVITRDVARDRDKAPEYLLSSFAAKLIFSSVCYLGICLYLAARGYTGLQLAVGYIISTMIIFESLDFSSRSVMVAVERQELSAIVAIATNVLRVVATLVLIYFGFNIVAVAWVTIIVMCLTLVLDLVVVRRLVRGIWRPTWKAVKYLVVVGFSFFAANVFDMIVTRADYILLDLYKTVSDVGIYSAAHRIIDIVTMVAYSSSLALFPIISRRVQGSKEAYARAMEKCIKYLTMVGIPLCGCVFLSSNQLMVGLYGSQFLSAGTCLAILIWGRLIIFPMYPAQQAVWARNAQLWLVPPAVLRLIVNVGLNIYLIPRHGVIGACIAMLVAENLHYTIMYIFVLRGPERFNPVTLLGRPVLAGLAMAAVVLLTRHLGVAIATAAGLIAYVLALPAFGAIDSDDKRILGGLVTDLRNRRRQAA